MSSDGVRQRVNRCMNKLSDRDTEAMAVRELDSLARSLSPDHLTPFISAISDARPSDKTPLRRHSLRLLSLISASHSRDTLSPILPRMLSSALRRLRDPDSSVRLACVDAVRSISSATDSSVFLTTVLRPVCDALLHEQDHHAQLTAALCLAAAVDAKSPHCPELAIYLQKLVPKFVKLLKSNAFKAKAALISLLGSIVAAGGASTSALTSLLVPCLVEALAWEDWAARKASSETLSVLAAAQRDLLVGFKTSCISSFESRRFDKVKIVRDSMNRMLDLWKEIPDVIDDDSNDAAAELQSRSPVKGSSSDGRYTPAPLSSSNSVRSTSPVVTRNRRLQFSRSPPSPVVTNGRNNKRVSPTLSRKSDCKIEISVSKTPLKVVAEERSYEEKATRVTGFKSSARVVPYEENSELEGETKGINGGQKEDGDLSKIRMQLVQIEAQQTNLLDLLQKFMGTSQNGIHSLETRVHGIEMALDEISRDLSSGRNSNANDNEAYTCCRLPGTEFLSAKYWRRNEGRYSSRFSVSETGESRSSYKWDRQRFAQQGGGFVVNPLAEINPQIMRGSTGESELTGGAVARESKKSESSSSLKTRAG
ncbi:TORTIFOLIA1-like protein 3 [Carex rostrata]